MILYQESNSQSNYNYNIFIYDNVEWQLHFHKNFEIVYVMDGEAVANIGGSETVMTKNQFAIVLPNQIHSYSTAYQSKVWIGVFSEDFISTFSKTVVNKKSDNQIFYCNDAELTYLKDALLTDGEKNILLLKACLYMLCNRFLNEVRLVEASSKNIDTAHIIIEYVEKHFKENISLESISQELGYEYHYVSHFFQKMFHMNFKKFLNQYRFEYAKNLIINTDKKLSDIALESGFGSIRNFNRIYCEFADITPKEERGKIRKD